MTPHLPHALKKGDTIGIVTPSWPGHCTQPEKFKMAISELERLGFKVKVGAMTQKQKRQGYRAAGARERASEFMELILDPEVKAIMSTLGGAVSNSLIPHLDFSAIRESKKIIIGHSDITSLLLAIHSQSELVVFYGPMLIPNFGEKPNVLDFTLDSFLAAITSTSSKERILQTPEAWSDEEIEESNPNWQRGIRHFKDNPGWKTLKKGQASGLSLAANLNTLCSNLGTKYLPDFRNRVLVIEQLEMDLQSEERQLSQLKLSGVLDNLAALVIAKPQFYTSAGAPFSGEDLYLEMLEGVTYPVLWGFDCGHTHPMHTIPIGVTLSVLADDSRVEIKLCSAAVR